MTSHPFNALLSEPPTMNLAPISAADTLRSSVSAAQTPEVDPTGKSPHEMGAKLDAGKPRMALVLGGFGKALLEVGKVGTFGAQKYTDNGWKEVPNGVERYTDALIRHQLDELAGETHDQDSTLLHAAHQAWNSLARLELLLRQQGDSK